jgi:uncharacterized protein YjbI with pentapeptide repeats
MDDQEQLERLKAGVEGWNQWRKENPQDKIDLSEADLSEVDLRKADLRGADLRRADLFGVNVSQSDLSEADLRKAKFTEANLMRAYESRADLFPILLDLSKAISVEPISVKPSSGKRISVEPILVRLI